MLFLHTNIGDVLKEIFGSDCLDKKSHLAAKLLSVYRSHDIVCINDLLLKVMTEDGSVGLWRGMGKGCLECHEKVMATVAHLHYMRSPFPKSWRALRGFPYWSVYIVDECYTCAEVREYTDQREFYDDNRHDWGNYFPTKVLAENAAARISRVMENHDGLQDERDSRQSLIERFMVAIISHNPDIRADVAAERAAELACALNNVAH